ncbi:unnamed protein product [Cladocopium goreaui]|uniref:J domain-containing protein n=1 Tax=Cladocopium goreaui TaxID=2562237 RepID=A0A9P1CKG7_9DINO|nr:unnamed protein product [Cladocopium goreaui]
MCALYQALGVAPSASKRTIRLAYLRLAKQLHPDVNKASGAEGNFQKVREAYEVLSDDARRREYDRQLSPMRSTSTRTYSGNPSGPRTWQGAQGRGNFRTVDEEARRVRQEHEALRRRAEAQFFMRFNQSRYRSSLSESLFRFLPLVLPIWTVLLLYSFYKNRSIDRVSPAESVFWDEHGRAWVRDAYGRFHRMPDLDRQVISQAAR